MSRSVTCPTASLRWAVVLGALMLAVISAMPQALSDERDKARNPPDEGSRLCLACHGPDGSYPVGAVENTKHGVFADPRTPSCTGCHGASARHARSPLTSKPDLVFGQALRDEPDRRNAACLACHKGGNLILWAGSPHDAGDVACASCHQLHEPVDRVREAKSQAGVCVSCHRKLRVQLHKRSRHPIPEGKVTCADCHDPHGAAGPALMARDTINDTCFQCHQEKRGPFLWNHQPVTENCALCHEPHGTTIAGMLKWRQPFLCQQCHEPTSHRGAIPSLTVPGGTTGTGVTLARGCTNCHTSIHGGNNPTDSAGARTFRR